MIHYFALQQLFQAFFFWFNEGSIDQLLLINKKKVYVHAGHWTGQHQNRGKFANRFFLNNWKLNQPNSITYFD